MEEASGPKSLPSYRGCFFCGKEGFLKLFYDGRKVFADFIAEDRFQGFDGIMHGGIVSGILDEVMWWRLFAGEGVIGVTWRMDVEFKRPILVGKRYRAVAIEVSQQRRRYLVEAFIEDERNVICASAKGIFVRRRDIRREDLLRSMEPSLSDFLPPTRALR